MGLLEDLTSQVSRLFSSKSNGSKLVYKLTDRLHYYKQVLLALSIVLLLGYSQFREHFHCQGVEGLPKETMKIFCWTNGTTTLNKRQGYSFDRSDRLAPHSGIHFQNDQRHELLTHNYMRDIWALLILMAACSFIAQKRWSSIFSNDIMKAALKLPGHNDLELVKRAQEAKAYEMLMSLPYINGTKSTTEEHLVDFQEKNTSRGAASEFSGGESTKLPLSASNSKQQHNLSARFDGSISILLGHQNEYNHVLDYYPNQLIYLLLAGKNASYKFYQLKLKQKLVLYSIWSFCLTALQFVFPCLLINHYKLYGWRWLRTWLKIRMKIILGKASESDTVEYQLSSQIFPISTQCQFEQYGLIGQERATIQCTVPINEISGKLFVVIWWVIVINIFIELYSLLISLLCASNTRALAEFFGRKFWRGSKKQAKVIATFRHKQAVLLSKKAAFSVANEAAQSTSTEEATLPCNGKNKKEFQAKEEEAMKKWYLWCLRDIGLVVRQRSKKVNSKKAHGDGKGAKSEDSDIYYLLYLFYLRLGRSQKKVEQIIKMTSSALSRYLEQLNKGLLPSLAEATAQTQAHTQAPVAGSDTSTAVAHVASNPQ